MRISGKSWIVIDIVAIAAAAIFVQYLISGIVEENNVYIRKECATFYTNLISSPTPEKIKLLQKALRTHNNTIIDILFRSEGYAGLTVKAGSKTIYHEGLEIPPFYVKSPKGPLVLPVGKKIWGIHQITIKPYRILLLFDLREKTYQLSENLTLTEVTIQTERPENAVVVYPLLDFKGKIGAFLVFRTKSWLRFLLYKLHTLSTIMYITFAVLGLFLIYLWNIISKFNRYIMTVAEYETRSEPAVKIVAGDALKYKIYRTAMITALSKESARDTIEAICNCIADMFDAAFWSVVFLGKKREDWKIFTHSKNFDHSCLEKAIKESVEPISHIEITIQKKSIIYHTKHILERHCKLKGQSDIIETVLDIPIFMEEEVVAIFAFYWSYLRKQRKEEEEIISSIQETLTEVIQSAYEIQDIHHRALKDPLLGIFNRNILNYIKENIKGCILFIDLDNFKQVNDKFGHDKGDEILKSVAFLIKKSLRKGDILLRYGGDEFVVILPETKIDSCLQIAERIRSTIYSNLEKSYGVTASIGVREIYPNETIKKSISEADKIMYKAKELGKNRVILSE